MAVETKVSARDSHTIEEVFVAAGHDLAVLSDVFELSLVQRGDITGWVSPAAGGP